MRDNTNIHEQKELSRRKTQGTSNGFFQKHKRIKGTTYF